MKLDKIVAVSGMPGLYRVVGNRNNGLIVEDLDGGRPKFVPSRMHEFTPLESIGIYTDDGDAVELSKVFNNMLDQLEDNPPVDANVAPEALHEYFADVLPTYDKDRVFTKDIKKVVKWFKHLYDRGLLTDADTTEEE